MSDPSWETQVLKISNLEKIFLTNDFDDPLVGFNTNFYIPCLRTDELVFHFPRNNVRNRLEKYQALILVILPNLPKLFIIYLSILLRKAHELVLFLFHLISHQQKFPMRLLTSASNLQILIPLPGKMGSFGNSLKPAMSGNYLSI